MTTRKSTVAVQDAMINWFVSEFNLNIEDVVEGLNNKHVINDETVNGFLMQKSIFNKKNKACSFGSINKATIVVKCSHLINDKKCKATVVKSGDRKFCHNHQPSVLQRKQDQKNAKIAEKQAKKQNKIKVQKTHDSEDEHTDFDFGESVSDSDMISKESPEIENQNENDLIVDDDVVTDDDDDGDFNFEE